MIKLIIAGGREFSDYQLMKSKLALLLAHVTDEITVISGTARGADSLGERWAKEHGHAVIRMPADWATHGRSAGYKRNAAMADVATHCVCFWDGKSRGTKHMIDLARQKKLNTRVVPY